MKYVPRTAGFTMIEVLIFLVVSVALLASATLAFSGQQRRTEFAQAVRDLDSRLQDIANDVSTGYYSNTNNFMCTASPSGGAPVLVSGTNNQGANADCTYIGRVIQFNVAGSSKGEYRIFTVVGRRTKANSDQDVTNFTEAIPRAIAQATTYSSPNGIETDKTASGVEVTSITSSACPSPFSAFGFFTDFTSSGLTPGSRLVNMVPICNVTPNQTTQQAAEQINLLNNSFPKNPADGIAICFREGNPGQYGLLSIGGSRGQLSTNVLIKDAPGVGCP